MKWHLLAGLLVCLMVVSCEQYAHSTHHLDAALHHYDTLHVAEVSHTSSVDHLRHSVTLRTLGRHFHMVLEWDRNIFTKDSVVYSVDGEGHRKRHDIDRHAFLRGHLKGEEESTIIAAHLPDSGVLTAVIATPTDTYHIEPSHHYIKEPHPFHMVAYARSHVKLRLNATQFDYNVPPTFSQDHHHGSWSKHRTESNRLRRQTGNIGGDTCNMILVADFSAFVMFRGVESASSQMVMVLSAIDKDIYRRTEWSVDVDDTTVSGLGFSAQEILVHTAPNSSRTDYNRDDTNSEAGEILGLMRFGPWRSFCLAHLFTNRNFPSGLLGLANIASPLQGQTGGICSAEFLDFDTDPPRSIIYNTGLSTYNNNGERMILSEMVRVVGHELGHNWGSHHDPSTNECDGNFLMNAFAQDGSRASHMIFSPCSQRSIGEVLVNKATCFMEPSSVCGDFQVAEGEACDAGSVGDECCTAQCTFTEGSICSDVNSLCCVDCRVADALTVCRTAPRLSISCTAETLCTGTDLLCPDTPEPADNGTSCRNGVCLLIEDSDTVTECVPLCETMNLITCTCGGKNECMVCCESGNGQCSPPDREPPLHIAEGSLCRSGACRAGECIRMGQDQVTRIWSIIVSLNASTFKRFLDENLVGFTLIFSIPLWCCGSCLLYWLVDYPRKKKFEDLIDKEGIGVYVRPSSSKRPTSDRQPLLVEEKGVDEPEDDLPPPKYHTS